MKKLLYILGFFTLLITTTTFAQDEQGGGKVREKMQEYLQKRLNLSQSEAEKFGPIFLNYFNELRQTNREFKGDRLVLQQKIADLRLRYRDQFKGVMGEKRSNDIFVYERDFVNDVRHLQEERMGNKDDRPVRRGKGLLQ